MDYSVKEIIENAFFRDEDFETTWMEILQEYNSLGFRDEISDQTMIEEYKYIAQQLRKYKFSKQDVILSHDSIDDMVAEVANLIGKAAEYGDGRKEIVYNFMRDHWLINLYNALVHINNANMNEEDEDE